MKLSKRRQGELLVEMGALSPYNLSRALVGRMEAKLLEGDFLSSRDGRFSFKKGHPRARPAGAAGIRHRRRSILEGIRHSLRAPNAIAQPFLAPL